MNNVAFSKVQSQSVHGVDIEGTAKPVTMFVTSTNVMESIAVTSGGDMFFTRSSGGGSAKTIWRGKAVSKVDNSAEVYTHHQWVRCVRVRRVLGKERVYFSAYKNATTVEIFYLNQNNKAVSYYAIDGSSLLLPDPCKPGHEAGWSAWDGRFVFDDNNHLYVCSGNSVPSGIFRISGAGADSVTGSITRIYAATSSLSQSLAFRGPNSLYFHRGGTKIIRLNLTTLEISPAYDTAVIPGNIGDICCIPPQIKKQGSLLLSGRSARRPKSVRAGR